MAKSKKTSNVKIKTNTSWKKVKLNENFTAQEVPDEFLGIEELCDYTLVQKSKKGVAAKKQVKEKTKKKKKTTKLATPKDVNLEDDESDEDQVLKTDDKCAGPTHDQSSVTIPEEPPSKKAKVVKENIVVEDVPEKVTDEIPDNFEVTPEMTIWKAMYLPDNMIRAVWELGFENPTAIQLAVLPTAMKGRKDVVGAAETGSGKTLAFGIPILAGILKDIEFEKKKAAKEEEDASDEEHDKSEDDQVEHSFDEKQDESDSGNEEELDYDEIQSEGEEDEAGQMEMIEGIGCVKVIDNIGSTGIFEKPASGSGKKLRALIITPTRELAVQIEKHLKAVAKYTGITMALVIGGMAAPKQERLLKNGPDIVIGTPGRLWELISSGNPHLSQINDIRYLALDETDRLLEQGHFAEVRTLLEHINQDEEKKKWRQNFVFSATLTLDHDLPLRLKHGQKKKKKKKAGLKLDNLLSLVGIRPKAKVVDLTSSAKQLKPATLSEMKLFSATLEDKDYYLYYFLRHHPGRTLIFCNSINNVRRLTSVFTLLQMKPLPLHAQMQQKQRLKNLERFSCKDNALLIATDVAARGLDIPHVQHVVHFQVPRTSENYVHRSGRTARASRDGLSLMLVEPGETGLYRQLCSTLKKQKTDLPDYDIDMKVLAAVKMRVNLAKEIESMEHRMKKTRSDESWVAKMAEEAELIIDDDIHFDEDDASDARHEQAQLVQALKFKRKQLETLISRPLKRSKP